MYNFHIHHGCNKWQDKDTSGLLSRPKCTTIAAGSHDLFRNIIFIEEEWKKDSTCVDQETVFHMRVLHNGNESVH
jgi:hypothetical protein